MKKIFTFILAMTLVFTAMGTTTALAAEPSKNETYSVESARASNTARGTMVGGSTVYSVPISNVGTNPTFSFSISGNENLYVDVVVVTPLGNETTMFSNIRCDGTTHTKSHFSLVTGTYYFTIRVNHGTSAGQSKPYTITASW